MIEILILYSVRKREKTLYGIRKDICDIFGAYTKPSIGTIHPALKKMIAGGLLTCSEKYSEGGKKSSYYGITNKGISSFKDMFFSLASDNPSLFYFQLQIRFAVMGMLNAEDRKFFIEDTHKKIEMYVFDIEARLKDEYLGLDYYQREIMKRTLSEMKSLVSYMKQLKVENAG